MVREQRKKKQNGQKGIRGLKARMERECCISRGGWLNSEVYMPEGSEGEATALQ